MRFKHRFQLFFTAYILITILIIGSIAAYYLCEAYTLFDNAENMAIAGIMAKKMFLKAIISFCCVLIVAAIVSVPAGIFLSGLVSRPYLEIFKRLGDIALKRLELDTNNDLNDNERDILNQYLTILITDYEKLRDYEKIKSWKDGARLLMHEIKNPMTPLKLSAESLFIDNQLSESQNEDIKRILTAMNDMEKILSYFKELVNIEFGPKETFDIKRLIDEFFNQQCNQFLVNISLEDDSIRVISEKTLLRMLFSNLINNGLESNAEGFSVSVTKTNNKIHMDFITSDKTIKNISRIFRPGYSEKSSGRGYGLFVCKLISDYLDINLTVSGTDNNQVVFSLIIPTQEI